MKRMIFLLILITIVCFGCQKKQKLTGRISFPDGKPLNVGVVFFVSDTYMGRGRINSDGTYFVDSEAERDGLPQGNYTVYISGAIIEDPQAKPEVVKNKRTQKEIPMLPLINPKYMNRETSPLKFTIPGEKEFNFTVEAP